MRRFLSFLALGLIFTWSAQGASFIWTGVGSDSQFLTAGNWQGFVAPPNDGTANLLFNIDFREKMSFGSATSIDSIAFSNSSGNTFKFTSPTLTQLTLKSGMTLSTAGNGGSSSDVRFDSNVNLLLSAAQTWQLYHSSTLEVDGQISGTSQLTLNGSGTVTLKGNDSYSGGTSITGVTVAAYTSSAFGTGTVTLNNSGGISAHNALTLTNAFTFNGSINLSSANALLTLSGPITLSAATTINSPPSPSQASVLISGAITGAFQLTKTGNSTLFLSGANSYSGGTTVGQGAVVFENASAVPSTGLVKVTGSGYAGVTFDPTVTPGFFSNLDTTSTGTIGLDTAPSASTTTFTSALDLSSLFASGSGIWFGTATSAILSSTAIITPPSNSPYRFAGLGTLTVQSHLIDNGGTPRGLMVSGSDGPFRLVLQGTDTYTFGTTVSGGVLIFDGASAIPSTGSLFANGSNAYIGITNNTGLTSTPASFLSLFNHGSSTGVIGFDTTNISSPIAITSAIDLSGFSLGVGLGTATAATISGSLTAPATGGLRFVAVEGGNLTVSSTIGSGAVTVANDSPIAQVQGTVTLSGTNTYTGGTTLNNSLRLVAGNASAFGTGTLTVSTNAFNSRLETTGNFTLANAIALPTTGSPTANLNIGGANDFTLSGIISGISALIKDSSDIITLSGTNTFSGGLTVNNGSVVLTNNAATGTGSLDLEGGSASYSNSALAPVIYGLDGISGQTLTLPTNSTLTLDSTSGDSDFGGTLTGTNASVIIQGGNSQAFHGANSYSGGTTITGGLLVGDNSMSFGTGGITLNASSAQSTGAYLALDRNTVITNPITLSAGTLIGYGTFSPSSAPVIGTHAAIGPGIPIAAGTTVPTGQLNFGTGLVFAGGGNYVWDLQDTSLAAGTGWDTISVTGNLNITANSGNRFGLQLESFDVTGVAGLANNFNALNSYSWTIATASTGITGFNANAFTLDTSNFTGPGVFTLTQSGNSLLLNFSPVPEPSTYALLTLGIGIVVGFSRRRRNRAS